MAPNVSNVIGYKPTMPFHMVWIATDACHLRCRHCSSNSEQGHPNELSTTEVKRLFDQLASAGVVDLAISGGEPLLRKDIYELIGYAKSIGFSVGIGSHGAKITRKSAVRLRNASIDRLQISLDGLQTSHEALRLRPGLFARALETIKMALAEDLRVHICCTINRLNVGELEDVVALAARLGVFRVNFSRFVPTGRGTADLDLPDAEWQKVVRRCLALREQYRGIVEVSSHLTQQVLQDAQARAMPGHVGCQAGAGQGCITADGTVLPCVLLPIPLGNIREKAFADIWESSPVNLALRDRTTLKGKCGSCQVRERCGGCRAVALARTGDFLAQDPRCWS